MKIQSLQNDLADHPFFAGMSDRHLELIAGCASNVRLELGQMIFREGEDAQQFYLIRQGKVALQMFSERRGPLTILTVGEGEVLGWSWLFPPYRWKFAARTLEPTHAIAIQGQCLRTKADSDHDLGYELLRRFVHVVEDRLDATRLQIVNVYQDR
jgi:CRP-like cAMP-binding protein